MSTETVTRIDAEIEGLRLRIRRLRIERKLAELTEAEREMHDLVERVGKTDAVKEGKAEP